MPRADLHPGVPHGRFAEEGEDLLQEIFLQAYRKLGSFKGDATLGRGCIVWRSITAWISCAAGRQERKADGRLDDGTCRADGPPDTPIARIDLERPFRGCRTVAERRSCCTTSRDSTTKR